MTDRYLTLTVLLKKETREDDAEHILNAIRMIKGVEMVEGNIADRNQWAVESRVRIELGQRLMDVLYPDRVKAENK